MKTTRTRATLTGLLLGAVLAAPAGANGPVHTIVFLPGHTHAQGHGYLTGIRDRALFAFHARAGWRLRVNIVGHGPTRGVLTFPNGQQDGGPGGVVFDDRLTQTGRYRLRVTESSMANAWHGTVVVYLTRH